MKAAGLAWIVSRHTLNNQSMGTAAKRMADSRSVNFSTGIGEAVVRKSCHPPKQKLNSRPWAKYVLLFKTLAASSINLIKKIPPIPGQRDVDQLYVRQHSQRQEKNLSKKNSAATAQEKIKSYEYTGH